MSTLLASASDFSSLEQALDWFINQPPSSIDSHSQRALEQLLFVAGERGMLGFVETIQNKLNINLGKVKLPPIISSQVAAPGFSTAENGQVFNIPSDLGEYQQERLRLMAKVISHKLFGRKIIVNVGIGYIGTANITAAASALDEKHNPLYCVIGYQRPSSHSSWKVNFMNQGLPTITTADNSLAEKIDSAHRRGNLTATYLQEQSLSVADIIFVETELHVRKYSPRAIERSEADPEATLKLIRQIASVMPAHALLVIESTVYPGFTLHDALPLVNQTLMQRGLIKQGQDSNLAYGFHRVKPGTGFMSSFYKIPRDAGGVTEQAAKTLKSYYDATGIRYQMHHDITTSELMKDIENASKFGLLDLMSAFMKSAEATGINGFRVIRAIAEARPDEHGRYIREIAGLQVGGYCVPKELGLLINGLRRHYDVSELQIRQMFYSRIVAAAISDYRAEDAVYHVTVELSHAGKSISESQLYWAGVSYKEGVGDTRMAGTERGLRYAAHLGADNRVTDPLVVNWPELQHQRLGDPECWGHGLANQEQLRDIQVHTHINLLENLSPDDDAVILAVRHPSYLGAGKPESARTDNEGHVHPGIDAITLSVKMRGQKNKLILDTFDFLSDSDIKKFLALGWQVRAFGKGHISKLKKEITTEEAALWQQELESRLAPPATAVNEKDEKPCVSLPDLANRLNEEILKESVNQLFSRFRQTGELLIALSDNQSLMSRPESPAEVVNQLQLIRYLKHAGLDGLNQDLDRLAHELMQADASLTVAEHLRLLRHRPDLAISNKSVEHPLFDQSLAPDTRLLPATVFVTANNGKLEKREDPEGLPYRLSTKWVPDLANLIQDKHAFPVEWSKFSIEVPINLRKVSDQPVEFDLYEDFLYLPLDFRDWLVNDIWNRGYVLTTLEGEPQNRVSYLMDVNLDPKTVARGRGGVLFWQDSREPVLLTTPEGHEIPLELKAIGDYLGGSAESLNVNYNRTIISGRVEGGGTAKTNLGQVPGHMFSADDINWQERLKTCGPYLQGLTPRSVFRVRWSYPEKPGDTFQMIGRASPSTMRLGHVFAGTDAFDVSPEQTAYTLGWNNAEVLGHDIAAVHIALNLDNVMSNNYYTDTGSNIDLFCERDPKGSFRDYAGYGLLMVIYTYNQMKAFQERQTALPQPCIDYLQFWFDGFLERFFSLEQGRKVPNKNFFERFYNVKDNFLTTDAPNQVELLIDEWLDTLWLNYVPYHVLRNRMTRGFNPGIETAFTTGREERMFDVQDKEKARSFLKNQLEVIDLANAIGRSIERPLNFDFDRAMSELNQKLAQLDSPNTINALETQEQPDYQDIYELSFYGPLQEDVFTILDHNDQNRLVIAKARPTVFIDKMDANINQRMRLSGLRLVKMFENSVTGEVPDIIRSYLAVWKGPESHAPGEYDIQKQENTTALLKLIQKDFRIARMLNQKHLEKFSDIEWLSVEAGSQDMQSGEELTGDVLSGDILAGYILDQKQVKFRLTENGELHQTSSSNLPE